MTPADLGMGDKLSVIATTSIVGDVVAQVGGDHIILTLLMPSGIDPHSYEPAAFDVAKLVKSDLIIAVGLNLEGNLAPNFADLQGKVPIVYASDGIEVLTRGELEGTPSPANGNTEVNPHVWQDPTNVIIWTQNIAKALSARDPQNASAFQDNAERYISALRELDHKIEQKVAEIPPPQRKLVTNHDTMSYFAKRYGFEVIGTVLPEGGEGSEPSAADLTRLVEAIKSSHIRAIFSENTLSDQTAEIVRQEAGDVKIMQLYTDTLGPPSSGAETYLDLMRTNADTIVRGLAQK